MGQYFTLLNKMKQLQQFVSDCSTDFDEFDANDVKTKANNLMHFSELLYLKASILYQEADEKLKSDHWKQLCKVGKEKQTQREVLSKDLCEELGLPFV